MVRVERDPRLKVLDKLVEVLTRNRPSPGVGQIPIVPLLPPRQFSKPKALGSVRKIKTPPGIGGLTQSKHKRVLVPITTTCYVAKVALSLWDSVSS